MQGTITVTVGDFNEKLFIESNETNWVSAFVWPNLVTSLFDAMDSAANMDVVVGNARPLVVSLAGSARVANAFRECAGIRRTSKTPGSNPFE